MSLVSEETGRIDLSIDRPFDEVRKGYTKFIDNDVIFAKITPCMENGKIAVARGLTSGVACASTEFHVIRCDHGITPDYIRYFLVQRAYRQAAERQMQGAVGQKRVPTSYLASSEVPVPPSREQQRIVEKIDELFSLIEAGERALERARKLLERYRQSVLNAAVTGDLTKDWREQHKGEIESGEGLLKRILKARREAWEKAELAKLQARGKTPTDDRWKQKYKEPQPPDLTDKPEIPAEWQLQSCDALAYHLTSGSRAWKAFYDSGKDTFVMAQNVRPGSYNANFRQVVDAPVNDPETERTRVRRGDLLVTIVGANTGDVCRFEYDFQDYYVCQSVALIRPWSETYGQFLNLYFQAEHGGQRQYKRYIYGAGRPHLSFDQLRQTVIALPSEREASEIVDKTEELLTNLDALASDILRQPTFYGALRQSILAAAFAGKLVPQDPADEPAAVLLERIRAGRAAAAVGGGPPSAARRRGRPRRTSEPELPLVELEPPAALGQADPGDLGRGAR